MVKNLAYRCNECDLVASTEELERGLGLCENCLKCNGCDFVVSLEELERGMGLCEDCLNLDLAEEEHYLAECEGRPHE